MKQFEKYKLTDKRIEEVEKMPVEDRVKMCARYGEGRCHIPCGDIEYCNGFGVHNVPESVLDK